MENYFNYFTEIEEYFWKRRSTAILLNSLDWALIDSWKESGIPIEAVLRGIDRTFEKHDARKTRGRKVNSLAYCHQAVLEAADEMARGELPHAAATPPFPSEQLTSYLLKNSALVAVAAQKLESEKRLESASSMDEIAASLREQAGLISTGEIFSLQVLENRVSILEEKMVGILRQTCPEERLLEIRLERDRQMAPFRSKMTPEQVRQLEGQFELRRLLEVSNLPRLSLFYM